MATTSDESVSILPYPGRSLMATVAACMMCFCLFSPHGATPHELLMLWVVAPGLMSACILARELVEWHRLRAIARRGVEVTGTVQAARRSRWWGRIARISYALDGKDFAREVRVPRDQAEGIDAGNSLPLLVDPEAPTRFAVRRGR